MCSASPRNRVGLADQAAVTTANSREAGQRGQPETQSPFIVYSEPDGRCHGWVTVGTKDDGSPGRRHRGGRTETEVTNKVRELERKQDSGKAGKAGRPLTVADWLETWLTAIAPRTVSQRTLGSTYEPKVRGWIVPQLGRHRLDRLQPEHLDAFYTWLAGQGSSRTQSCRSTGSCPAP